MDELLTKIVSSTNRFLQKHAVGETSKLYDVAPLTGEFALHREQSTPDLYGMIDAVYILFILNKLPEKTDRSSRKTWARQILACQDDQGWFSKLNLRGHSREHATAYAIGALRLLEVESDEDHITHIKPLTALLPILTDYATFLHWIERLNFRLTPRDILSKNVGWHHIWRGSHIGGGIAALVGMTRHLFEQWWPAQANAEQWFAWYFDWLDAQANPKTGYWQRAFWNLIYRKPTMIDMGGAVHFFWIYEALARPFPYPAQVIESTTSLQKTSGLYKNHPFCIDLDGNFCIIRSFLQLPKSQQQTYQRQAHQSINANFRGVVHALTQQPLEQIYTDSHGLPGALAALAECAKLPNFEHAEHLAGWQNPFDKAWWL